jgi:hypothetical protein
VTWYFELRNMRARRWQDFDRGFLSRDSSLSQRAARGAK